MCHYLFVLTAEFATKVRPGETCVCLRKNYCFSLWPCSDNCRAIAVRVLTGTKGWKYIPPVLTSLHLPPVHTTIDFKLLSLVHKTLTALAPQYTIDLFKSDEPLRVIWHWSSHCTEGSNLNLVNLPFISYAAARKATQRIWFTQTYTSKHFLLPFNNEYSIFPIKSVDFLGFFFEMELLWMGLFFSFVSF